jgi:hypothetical protein
LPLLCTGPAVLHAQELVVNGGMETRSRCPAGPSVKKLKVDGRVKTVQGDPDLYASCSVTFGVPENWSGLQAAWEGDAYAGLVLTSDMPNECGMREYLQFPLSAPLEAGNRYRLTFRVSAAEHSGYVTDRVAARFSTDDLARKGLPPALRERPDVANPLGRMLNDTSGWTTVTGIYNAMGGERYVIIGNFHPCNSSTRVRMHAGAKASMERKAAARLDPVAKRGAWRQWMARTAYVYLDGVSLVPDTTTPAHIAAITPEQACPMDVPRAMGPELVADPGFDHNAHPTPTSWRNASAGTPDLLEGVTGIYLYSAGHADNREYIRTPLNATLSPCSTYRISMEVRLNPTYAYAVDAIGVAVTDTFSTRHDRLLIDLPWAWRSPPGALLMHSDQALTLCGTFTPSACADQLLVGNFGADSTTTIVKVGAEGDGPFAYVFVDNVHLTAVAHTPGCVDPCTAPKPLVAKDPTPPVPMPELLVIRFDSDQDDPLAVDTELLDKLVAMLKATPGAQLSITGHTDASGTAVRNQQLALDRAVRMRELLVARGASATSIQVSSAGSSVPLATNATPEGRAMNRRVEVEVLR